jgi:hypothetical protein
MDGPMAPPTHHPRLAASGNHAPVPHGAFLAPWWSAMGKGAHLRDFPWCILRATDVTLLSAQACAQGCAPWRLQPDGWFAKVPAPVVPGGGRQRVR